MKLTVTMGIMLLTYALYWIQHHTFPWQQPLTPQSFKVCGLLFGYPCANYPTKPHFRTRINFDLGCAKQAW